MKKEILCIKCIEQINTHPTYISAGSCYSHINHNEHIKLTWGYALMYYRCDLCDNTILKDDVCCASSMWSDVHGIPYHEWEQDYIKIDHGIPNKLKVAQKIKEAVKPEEAVKPLGHYLRRPKHNGLKK